MGELAKMNLVSQKDFSRGRADVPIRFELEVLLEDKLYSYTLALDLPEKFKELRVFEEQLLVAGEPIYSRKEASVTLFKSQQNREALFLVDWHLVALPVIQEQSEADPLHVFRTWLAHTIILAPIPALMVGSSSGETLMPDWAGTNFGEWFTGLLSQYPAAYTQFDEYIRNIIPDMRDVQNERV